MHVCWSLVVTKTTHAIVIKNTNTSKQKLSETGPTKYNNNNADQKYLSNGIYFLKNTFCFARPQLIFRNTPPSCGDKHILQFSNFSFFGTDCFVNCHD